MKLIVGHTTGMISAAADLLGLWVRILPKTWKCAFCECCVLSGLRWADQSSRGVLPSVVCLSVIVKSR